MLVGCVAGRFAAILAMATETMHSLAHRVSIVYLFFTDDLQNRIIEQTVYFILFFCCHVCEHIFVQLLERLRGCNEQCMLLFSLDEVDRRQLSEQEKCLETRLSKKVLRRISNGAGRRTTSRDFVARGQKRLAPLAKRSTCNKSIWKRSLLNPEPVSYTGYSEIHVQKISYRQAFHEPILTADLDNLIFRI